MSVTIKVRKNGPYLVTGICELTDNEGKPIEVKESFALCRCGASQGKPMCDGTHNKIGFSSDR
jgi:CDGSH-type Zn-finger protein